MIFNFIISEGVNQKELEDLRFTKKVFKATEAFSKHFNFDYEVLWNGVV